MGFCRCLVYIVALGIVSFVLGRLLPKAWFRFDRAPFRAFGWEKDGRVYLKIGINRWQNHVPDMSRIFSKLMPKKAMDKRPDQAGLLLMIRETCVAEAVHVVLCALGLPCLWLWPGIGGAAVYAFYVLLGNLPFILIQRYNRPRLVRMYRRREKQKEGTT